MVYVIYLFFLIIKVYFCALTHCPIVCLFLQIGTFTTHSGQFFLEPLLSADGEYEEEHNKPHLVYKHDTHRKSPDTQPCTTSGESVRCPLLSCESLMEKMCNTGCLRKEKRKGCTEIQCMHIANFFFVVSPSVCSKIPR